MNERNIYYDHPPAMEAELENFRMKIRSGILLKALELEFSESKCPLKNPELCSEIDGGVFGEYAYAQLTGINLHLYADVEAIVAKCKRCRDFVEEIKRDISE